MTWVTCTKLVLVSCQYVSFLHYFLHHFEAGLAHSMRLWSGLPGGGGLVVATGTAHHTPTVAAVVLEGGNIDMSNEENWSVLLGLVCLLGPAFCLVTEVSI